MTVSVWLKLCYPPLTVRTTVIEMVLCFADMVLSTSYSAVSGHRPWHLIISRLDAFRVQAFGSTDRLSRWRRSGEDSVADSRDWCRVRSSCERRLAVLDQGNAHQRRCSAGPKSTPPTAEEFDVSEEYMAHAIWRVPLPRSIYDT